MAGQQFSQFFSVRRLRHFCVFVSCQPDNSASITAPPAVQLSLQPLNGLLHWPVLLLFLLVLLLPLLCCELQVHRHSISNGLGSNWRECGEKQRKSRKEREGRKQCESERERYRKYGKKESVREQQRIELSTSVFQPRLLNENVLASH